MSSKAGVWLDHKRASIVFLENEQIKMETIECESMRKIRPSGGFRTHQMTGAMRLGAEDIRERKVQGVVRRYYDQIIARLRRADKITLLGPGDAKLELKKRMMGNKELARKIVHVETADKMSDRQFQAKIRKQYAA